ncbi:hypothetical protein AGMMS49928_22940 [Spirochaetia bacterium]|nr:hypothetical protein AGMMS49928_22940 [Spirochaetia bacterium]
MKKYGFVFAAAITMITIFSCQDPLLQKPFLPAASESSGGKIMPPQNISAAQGEKRGITLSWTRDTKASMYYIYRASSPLDTFVQCAETSSAQYKFSEQPGSTVYYRISSVSREGTVSPQSSYVMGTSLARPVISDIAGITESSAIVTWSFTNVSTVKAATMTTKK